MGTGIIPAASLYLSLKDASAPVVGPGGRSDRCGGPVPPPEPSGLERFSLQGTPSSSGPICPHPGPKSPPTPQPAMPGRGGVSQTQAGLQGREPPAPGGRNGEQMLFLGSTHFGLTLPCGEARGTRKTVGEAGPGQLWPARNTHRRLPPTWTARKINMDRRRSSIHARAPVLAPNQCPLRHHASYALFLSSRHAHSHNLPYPSLTPPSPQKLRPLQRKKPAPCRPTGLYVQARECVPAPALSSARSLSVPALSPHCSRCRWRARGREQRRAASPPPLRPGPGSVPPRPAPSAPHPRRVREGPSHCWVPEGLRGRSRHGS